MTAHHVTRRRSPAPGIGLGFLLALAIWGATVLLIPAMPAVQEQPAAPAAVECAPAPACPACAAVPAAPIARCIPPSLVLNIVRGCRDGSLDISMPDFAIIKE